MAKVNNHGTANNNAIRDSDSFASVPQNTSKNFQEHGRLAVFIEYPSKSDYFTKPKKTS